MCLSNYSIMSASTTIHWSTQLFEFDCVSCTFLDTIGAGVERKTYPDAATDDGHEEVNQSDTVSIPAVALDQPIPTRVIASADSHAIHGVHPLAI